MRIILSCLLLMLSLQMTAQPKQTSAEKTGGTLFQAGVASAFIGGLYHAVYSYPQLKQHGDFGLGAPDKLDGEIVMLNGKIYQTQYTGRTFEVKDTGSTSLAMVTFFKNKQRIIVPYAMNKNELFRYLDSTLQHPNTIYAIHINGAFDSVKTRAFPPPPQPWQPLASMLGSQHFFTFPHVTGDLVGYRLPLYLEALSIHGYHFHFLSSDKNHGGHIIDVIVRKGTVIEIDPLNGFSLAIPGSENFDRYNFETDRKEELKSVENGKK
ncbi:MAG TPA: acetolactate decarboxylase [Chitinophaga sp.]|uniref:acetolactate decarboxylase n=1 Tax=Chitinophaga sp. TaxID=1869181 RepID=UPI002BA9565F|nr:acetolactate decarboxylase [Chitinophaga sp.]HVI44652.1 acetolactate decarboxylase [Chitinophaga sp.]